MLQGTPVSSVSEAAPVSSVSTGAAVSGTLAKGVTVSAEGVLTRDGRPYRGIGVNYFSAFIRRVRNPADTSYRQGFKVLGERKIPFARIMACGYYPNDFKLYLEDKEAFLRLLDDVVKAAEESHVGLVADLFWNYPAVPDLVGEPMDQWGNPKSKTHAFMRQYIQDVVGRYKNSPAIWGWEFGNEFMLSADLPNAASCRPPVLPDRGTPSRRTGRDDLTHEMIATAYAEFGRCVRRIDPVRLLTTGNSIPRAAAWHNALDRSWTADTREQFAEVLLRDNPDPMNVVSIHIYTGYDDLYFADHRAENPELIQESSRISAQAKKPLFVGEFGIISEIGTPQAHERIFELLRAIETGGVALAAIWNFDRDWETHDLNISPTNENAYVLDLVAEANGRIGKELEGPAQSPR